MPIVATGMRVNPQSGVYGVGCFLLAAGMTIATYLIMFPSKYTHTPWEYSLADATFRAWLCQLRIYRLLVGRSEADTAVNCSLWTTAVLLVPCDDCRVSSPNRFGQALCALFSAPPCADTCRVVSVSVVTHDLQLQDVPDEVAAALNATAFHVRDAFFRFGNPPVA